MDKKNILIILLIAATVLLSYNALVDAEADKSVAAAAVINKNASTAEDRMQQTAEIYTERQNIITKTIAEVSPAVVGINVTEIRQFKGPSNPLFNDPFFRRFFGYRTYSKEVKSLGSGFFISDNGYILTNDHVAGDAIEIVVTLTDGRHLEAVVVGTDPVSDICLLKVEGEDFPRIQLGNSDEVIIGEWAIALGNPFGLFEVSEKPTVTVGVVSATGMNLDPVDNRYYLDMIQTDAAINGGNSGGPLINSLGEVIGMNTIIYTAGTQGSIGLGFAIPVNKISRIIAELKEHGKIDRNFATGMAIQDIDEGLANYFGLSTTKGVIITRIKRDSAADNAGLKPGDIITRIEDFIIKDEKALIGALQEFRAGQTITLHILRDQEKLTVNLDLERAQ